MDLIKIRDTFPEDILKLIYHNGYPTRNQFLRRKRSAEKIQKFFISNFQNFWGDYRARNNPKGYILVSYFNEYKKEYEFKYLLFAKELSKRFNVEFDCKKKWKKTEIMYWASRNFSLEQLDSTYDISCY